LKKLEFKILRELGVAAVVQISDRIHVTSKENIIYRLAKAHETANAEGKAAHETEKED
jgi:hypothetical protein